MNYFRLQRLFNKNFIILLSTISIISLPTESYAGKETAGGTVGTDSSSTGTINYSSGTDSSSIGTINYSPGVTGTRTITTAAGSTQTLNTFITESGASVTTISDPDSTTGTTQISFSNGQTESLTIGGSEFSTSDSQVAVAPSLSPGFETINSIEAITGVDVTATINEVALQNPELQSAIESTLGSGSVIITVSPVVTQAILTNVVNSISTSDIALVSSEVSPITSVALKSLIVATKITGQAANTILPTALNDVLVALSSDLAALGETASDDLKALAIKLSKVKGKSIPSLAALDGITDG